MRRLLVLILLILAAGTPLRGQDVEASPKDSNGEISKLEELSASLEVVEGRLTELREELKAAISEGATEGELQDIRDSVAKQRDLVESLRDNLLVRASGIEKGEYVGKVEVPVTLQQNMEDIIEPISRAMRDLTKGPREIEKLEKDLEHWEFRMGLVKEAQPRLSELLVEAEDGSNLKEELLGFQQLWNTREAEAESQVRVLRHQLEERRKSTPTGWDAISIGLADFWRSRGMNLLIAFLAACLVFFLVRWPYRQFLRVSSAHQGKRRFGARAADLSVALLSVVLAIGAAVLVFYLRGDWLLLAVAAVMILGVVWASKQAVPPYLNQLKMILNLGSVRQGERIVYEGIPWQVTRLAFFCEFRNPDLEGGTLRLPANEVLSLHSREQGSEEPWFPTRTDDWVILGDDTHGKVVEQTPEQVVVEQLGGSRKTYPTSDFLGLCPDNLSRGFRVRSLFGIGYELQPISTTEVPGVFLVALKRELALALTKENVRLVEVEFASARDSSLDYQVIADFDGAVASQVNVLRRMMQRVCVEVCNEQGWGIPFTQITVHQAK